MERLSRELILKVSSDLAGATRAEAAMKRLTVSTQRVADTQLKMAHSGQQAGTHLLAMAQNTEQALRALDRFNPRVARVAYGLNSLVSKIGAVNTSLAALTATYVGRQGAAIYKAGMSVNANMETSVARMASEIRQERESLNSAMRRSQSQIKWVQQYRRQEGRIYGQDELQHALSDFAVLYRGDMAKAQRATRAAALLAAKNPHQGIEGAKIAIQEAESGQWTSPQRRFFLPKATLEKYKDMGGLGAIEATLKDIKVTPELLERMGETLPGIKGQIEGIRQQMYGLVTKDAYTAKREHMKFVRDRLMGLTAEKGAFTKIGGVVNDIGGKLSRVYYQALEFPIKNAEKILKFLNNLKKALDPAMAVLKSFGQGLYQGFIGPFNMILQQMKFMGGMGGRIASILSKVVGMGGKAATSPLYLLKPLAGMVGRGVGMGAAGKITGRAWRYLGGVSGVRNAMKDASPRMKKMWAEMGIPLFPDEGALHYGDDHRATGAHGAGHGGSAHIQAAARRAGRGRGGSSKNSGGSAEASSDPLLNILSQLGLLEGLTSPGGLLAHILTGGTGEGGIAGIIEKQFLSKLGAVDDVAAAFNHISGAVTDMVQGMAGVTSPLNAFGAAVGMVVAPLTLLAKAAKVITGPLNTGPGRAVMRGAGKVAGPLLWPAAFTMGMAGSFNAARQLSGMVAEGPGAFGKGWSRRVFNSFLMGNDFAAGSAGQRGAMRMSMGFGQGASRLGGFINSNRGRSLLIDTLGRVDPRLAQGGQMGLNWLSGLLGRMGGEFRPDGSYAAGSTPMQEGVSALHGTVDFLGQKVPNPFYKRMIDGRRRMLGMRLSAGRSNIATLQAQIAGMHASGNNPHQAKMMERQLQVMMSGQARAEAVFNQSQPKTMAEAAQLSKQIHGALGGKAAEESVQDTLERLLGNTPGWFNTLPIWHTEAPWWLTGLAGGGAGGPPGGGGGGGGSGPAGGGRGRRPSNIPFRRSAHGGRIVRAGNGGGGGPQGGAANNSGGLSGAAGNPFGPPGTPPPGAGPAGGSPGPVPPSPLPQGHPLLHQIKGVALDALQKAGVIGPDGKVQFGSLNTASLKAAGGHMVTGMKALGGGLMDGAGVGVGAVAGGLRSIATLAMPQLLPLLLGGGAVTTFVALAKHLGRRLGGFGSALGAVGGIRGAASFLPGLIRGEVGVIQSAANRAGRVMPLLGGIGGSVVGAGLGLRLASLGVRAGVGGLPLPAKIIAGLLGGGAGAWLGNRGGKMQESNLNHFLGNKIGLQDLFTGGHIATLGGGAALMYAASRMKAGSSASKWVGGAGRVLSGAWMPNMAGWGMRTAGRFIGDNMLGRGLVAAGSFNAATAARAAAGRVDLAGRLSLLAAQGGLAGRLGTLGIQGYRLGQSVPGLLGGAASSARSGLAQLLPASLTRNLAWAGQGAGRAAASRAPLTLVGALASILPALGRGALNVGRYAVGATGFRGGWSGLNAMGKVSRLAPRLAIASGLLGTAGALAAPGAEARNLAGTLGAQGAQSGATGSNLGLNALISSGLLGLTLATPLLARSGLANAVRASASGGNALARGAGGLARVLGVTQGMGGLLRGSARSALKFGGGALAKRGVAAIPVIGTMLGAGMAGWDTGKWLGSQKVGGQSINDRVQNFAYMNLFGGRKLEAEAAAQSAKLLAIQSGGMKKGMKDAADKAGREVEKASAEGAKTVVSQGTKPWWERLRDWMTPGGAGGGGVTPSGGVVPTSTGASVASGWGASAKASGYGTPELDKQIAAAAGVFAEKTAAAGGDIWGERGAVRRYNGLGKNKDGTWMNPGYVTKIRGDYDAQPWVAAMGTATGARKTELEYINAQAEKTAKGRGMDPNLLKAIMWHESMGWQPGLGSSDGKGAGLGQVTGYKLPPIGQVPVPNSPAAGVAAGGVNVGGITVQVSPGATPEEAAAQLAKQLQPAFLAALKTPAAQRALLEGR